MLGLMQGNQLTTLMLLERLEERFIHKTVVTGPYPRRTEARYGDVAARARRLGGVLDQLQVPPFARVGTLGFNCQEHLELYLAVPSTSRVLHTLNHRLSSEDLRYIINDAADDVIFVARSLLDVLWPVIDEIPTVRHIVVINDGAEVLLPEDPRLADYDSLLAAAPAVQPQAPNERSAAVLCYTSGTTGRPKGVLYDHRSIILHAMSHLFVDSFGLREADVVMPIVPMFHANAWGLPYAACLSGSSLVLPGRSTDPGRLAELFDKEKVSVSAAVTTVWRTLLPHLRGLDLPHLRTLANGGGPLPVELSREYLDTVKVPITGTWGMTEASPTLTTARSGSAQRADTPVDLHQLSAPGYPNPLVRLRLMREDGSLAAHDGVQSGELQVTGSTVASSYFGANPGTDSFTSDGWLRTGDVGIIDPDGCVHVVDRLKDLIKSGGEWIGSAELENAIMAHPGVYEAAVIARPDEKWGERPVAYVVVHEGHLLTAQAVRDYLGERVARWWIPDEIMLVEDIPKTATGKISKKHLRELHSAAVLGT
ncbi:long-chain-fatty-acid--CoA ligase [Glutamicibacter sp.]|uniref:long-chain-fatty-acid--CoA ligase n=1 Tax=Glutamicibacter sp. TaxID=1931995 RepID=UPI002FE07DE9